MDSGLTQSRYNKSLRIIIKRGMAVIAILLFLFCVFFIYSVWKQLKKYEISAYTVMLQLQVQAVENEFKKMQEELAVFASSDENLSVLKRLPLGTDYNFQKIQVNMHLREILNRYSYVNGLFVAEEKNNNFISQYNSGSSYSEMTGIKRYFEGRLEKDGTFAENRNLLKQIEGEYYYFYTLPADGVMLGGWCNLDGLFSFAKDVRYPFTGVSCELDGTYYDRASKNMDMSVQVTGDVTHMKYSLYLSKRGIYAAVSRLMFGNAIICIAILGVVMFILIRIANHVIRSISFMEQELKIIGENHLEHRIQKSGELIEFQMLYDSLNQMLEQVCGLKIQIYEEQMEKQKIYTSYLTMQMNPHFYVNSLNVIHSLAQMKNYTLIEKMTGCLSGYLNYMFRKDKQQATVGEELEHVRNFLDIQCIRYGTDFILEVQLSEDRLERAGIPVLLIHTFVENSVKYFESREEELRIQISMKIEGDAQECEKVNILIEDNGHGFDGQVLQQILENIPVQKADGEHIGIRNLKERAVQYFHGEFQLYCYNDCGACVVMEFPYRENVEEGKWNC